MTATAKPKLAEIKRQSVEDSEAILEAAESILRSCEHPTDVPDPSDLAVLRLVGIDVDNPQALQQEIARALRVNRLQDAAGSKAEYAQAQSARDAAVSREAAQRPEQEEIISVAQSKLSEMSAATTAAQQRANGMATSREHLRDLLVLPKYVRDRVNRERKYASAQTGGKAAELESRITSINGILALDPLTRDAMLYCQTHLRDAIVRGQGGANVVIDAGAWRNHQAELQAELAQATKELQPLRKRLDADMAEADKLRNFYVDQL